MEQCPRCWNDKCSCPSKSCKCTYQQMYDYKESDNKDLDLSWREEKYWIVKPYIWQTDKWWTYFWNFLHTLTYIFPEDGDCEKYRNVARSIADLVPIWVCSWDALLFFDQYVNFTNKEEFIISMIEFHNTVNRKLWKKELTKEEAVLLWNRNLKPTETVQVKQTYPKWVRQIKWVNWQLTYTYN